VTSTALALATWLGAHAVAAAPAALAAKVTRAALAGATATGASLLVLKLLALSKAQLAIAALAATAAAVVIFASFRTPSTQASLTAQTLAAKTNTPIVATAAPAQPQKTATEPSTNGSTSKVPANSAVLHLTVLAKETGEPMSSGTIDYRGWVGGKFKGQKFTINRAGNCDVIYPTNTTELQLTTRSDGFADTRLTWRPPNGDVIPANYVLKVDPGVPIGGQVLDADGNPVADAKVGWNHKEDPSSIKGLESHEFSWIETTTDQRGRWQINRIAEDMIRRIYGSARHTNYVDSQFFQGGRDKDAEKQLRDGTHIFHLGRGITARGVVVDSAGTPVSDAKVLIGRALMAGRREGITASDGTFSVAGCRAGKDLVTAEAPGFAPTTIESELSENSEPIHLTLQSGKNLRFRVIDQTGNPVPKAVIMYDTLDGTPGKTLQAHFNEKTDEDGRVTWTNAPLEKLQVSVFAGGYSPLRGVTISTNDEEHVITISSAVFVSGQVRDATTHEPISRFRIIEGYPQWNPMDGSTNPTWGHFQRFQHDFTADTYHLELGEPVVGGTKNPGWFLKFSADGYASFTSRIIRPDEGTVQLNVDLKPAKDTVVTVTTPGGQPAVGADVGLVQPLSRLALTFSGGFSRANPPSVGTLLRTDSNGQFNLPADDSIMRVIVATPDGYAESTVAALTDNPVMRLLPYGSLEVTCVSGGKPIVGRDYVIEFGGGSAETVNFDSPISHVKTDEQGRITVEKLPPGKHNLVRIYVFKTENGVGHSAGDKIPFEIHPGETTRLSAGDSEHTVSARLQWPAGMQPGPEWLIQARLCTRPTVTPPPELQQKPEALQAFFRSPECRATQENARSYLVTVAPDRTLSADGVRPGEYTLWVDVYIPDKGTNFSAALPGVPPPRSPNAFARVTVNVPDDSDAGNIDTGPVELHRFH
ncbi:MAG: carboxypeptidase regulatory-like domain-containing protein, partial [Limisphaerales bacterium]